MIRIQAQGRPSRLTAAIQSGIGAILMLVAGAVFACTGRVVSVTDGDTIKVLCDRTEVKVRLAEIDAPERGQPFGGKAKVVPSELVFECQVRLDVTDTDRYGRSIARVWVGKTDANREMIRRPISHLRCATRQFVHGFVRLRFEASEKDAAVTACGRRAGPIRTARARDSQYWLVQDVSQGVRRTLLRRD